MIIAVPILKDIEVFSDQGDPLEPRTLKVYVRIDYVAYKQNPAKIIGYLVRKIQNEYNYNPSRFEGKIS